MSFFKPLKDGPNAEIIHTLLETSIQNKNATRLTLEDKILIVKYLIPLTTSLSKGDLQNVYKLFCEDFTLLVQFMEFMKDLEPNGKECRLYRDFLINLLSKNHSLLFNYIISIPIRNNTFYKNNVKAMFFGSKIFNILYDEKENFTTLTYIDLLTKQWKYLVSEIQKTPSFQYWEVVATLLNSFLTFHSKYTTATIFDDLFLLDMNSFTVLLKMLDLGTNLDKSKIIEYFIIPNLELRLSPQNYSTVQTLVKKIINVKSYNINLKIIIPLKSLEFQEILIRSLSKNSSKTLLELLIGIFMTSSDDSNMMDENLQNERDERIAQLLFICLKYNFTLNERIELSHHEAFLNCITHRLKNKNNDMRERTMFLAKYVTNGVLKYDTKVVLKIQYIEILTDEQDIDFTNLGYPHSNVTLTNNNTVSLTTQKVSQLSLVDSDDEDSDDEDEDDNHNRNTKYIVFLKDLLQEYVNINQNQRNDLISLLKQTVRLVRQKSLLPLEVNYYAQELMKNIVTLNNNFDEKDFEQWRINALISLVVVIPEKVGDLFKILFNSELSLQQRMSILTSVGLASRELRGMDDENVVKPKYDFPSKRLPWDSSSTKKIEDVSNDEAYSLVGNGITTWKSKKLDIDANHVEKRNRFRKYADKFFYPLVSGWLNGIDLGSYDHIFKAHYISTLRIVYGCANPVHNYEKMTEMMELIICQAMEQNVPFDI